MPLPTRCTSRTTTKHEIHPQDTAFLDLEPWDWDGVPLDKYPLLLNFHPLVIYRHQVLKQADVVLAMYLRSQHFTPEQKRRNFDFYDPITTGDSSLSACVQAIIAAEVGHEDLAIDYFRRALYLDICDVHHNTADGVHIANCGGVWAGIVHGFAGMVETGEVLSFAPRLPADWSSVRFRINRHGSMMQVDLDARRMHAAATSTVSASPCATVTHRLSCTRRASRICDSRRPTSRLTTREHRSRSHAADIRGVTGFPLRAEPAGSFVVHD